MAEYYNADGVVVTDEAVTVRGNATPLSELERAEEYQVEDLVRNVLIFIVGCLAPISAMIAYTQLGLIQILRPYGFLAFGSAILVTVVILGALAAAIGHFWPKPWGVVVERKEIGFDRLVRSPSKEEAVKAAAAINKALGVA
jgi:hypothetical protein